MTDKTNMPIMAKRIYELSKMLDVQPPEMAFDDGGILLDKTITDWLSDNNLDSVIGEILDPETPLERVVITRGAMANFSAMDQDGQLSFLELTRWATSFPELDIAAVWAAFRADRAYAKTSKFTTAKDWVETRQRLRERAVSIAAVPPIQILDDEGAFKESVMLFCHETNTSFDWLFAGQGSVELSPA